MRLCFLHASGPVLASRAALAPHSAAATCYALSLLGLAPRSLEQLVQLGVVKDRDSDLAALWRLVELRNYVKFVWGDVAMAFDYEMGEAKQPRRKTGERRL